MPRIPKPKREIDVEDTTKESVTLPVVGMTCAACQHHVEDALRKTAGVAEARVDLMAHRARVTFDPKVAQPEALVAAIRQAGYDAVLPRTGNSTGESEKADAGSAAKAYIMLGAGAAAMVAAMPLGSQMGAADQWMMRAMPWLYAVPPNALRWSLLVVTAVLMIWAGRSIFANAWRGLQHRTTNMNTLVALGTSVAFALFRVRDAVPCPSHAGVLRRGAADPGLSAPGQEPGGTRQAAGDGSARFAEPPAGGHSAADRGRSRDAGSAGRDQARRRCAGAAWRTVPGGRNHRRRPYHRR